MNMRRKRWFSHSVWMGWRGGGEAVHKFVGIVAGLHAACVCITSVTEPEREKEEGVVCLCATPHALIKKKTASAGHE